jgi:S1-C subfamily serine protease
MQRLKTFFASSFGSAVLGGLVVAIAGLVLIGTGVVGTGDDSGGSSLAAAPLTRPASDNSTKGLTVNQIYDKDANGVAFISSERTQNVATPFGFPQQQQSTATGSGFVIDNDGHILTNAHVVEGADKIQVQVGDDDNTRTASLVGVDPSTDVALLHVDEDNDLHPLTLGDSSSARVGDPVVAIGNPFGLDRTVTSGIVSALQREIQAPNGFSISDVIQTDAAINPGNSGGPLLNADGEVIGINSQIASQSGGNEGVGFAVPIKTAKDVAEQLLHGGKVEQPYLGITGGDLTPQIANALNLSVDHGAIVERVVNGGPADDAGLKGASGQGTIASQTFPVGGDVITEVEGDAVTGMQDVIDAVNSHHPGDEIQLTVVRGGDTQQLTVTLGDRPDRVQGAVTQP